MKMWNIRTGKFIKEEKINDIDLKEFICKTYSILLISFRVAKNI